MALFHQAGVLLFLLESVSSLRMEVYPNAGFGGTPVVTTIEDVNNITWYVVGGGTSTLLN